MLTVDEFQDILSQLKVRFADLRMHRTQSTTFVLKDGRAEELSTGVHQGISLRVLDRCWGFAYSTTTEKLREMLAYAARAAALGEGKVSLAEVSPKSYRGEVKAKQSPASLGSEEKLEILMRAHSAAEEHEGVASVTVSYHDAMVEFRYCSTEGAEIEVRYPWVSLQVQVVARDGGELQHAQERAGGVAGLEVLGDVEELAERACERALRLLRAKHSPAGRMKVVMDPKLTGVFIHEALGHAAEADHVLRGESVLAGMLGSTIAAEQVSIYDDPCIEGSPGYYLYDAEGVAARRKALVERGVLRAYLHTRETAGAMKQEAEGNARAQGYAFPPLPRMSNTCMQAGDAELEEMLECARRGVYLCGSRGGEVDTARGVFQFSAEEGFLIEGGELTTPLRDVSLSGETLEILRRIELIGRRREMHPGYCGKDGQLVPVGDLAPALLTTANVGGRV
ncbi:MAG: TldD/PmbA family protein [Euryarchaeota archaeon]|nr:TldD/PmbA family protein [Euryarchaeota archaeon]